MDGVLFTIPDWLDYADFNNYPSEENPTTNADFIDYANNQNILLGALVAAVLWQPNTNFIAGKIIISPNMPEGMEAVALTGGVTGTAEPAWESGTEEYQDSGVKWKLRYKHWSKDGYAMADYPLRNKEYSLNAIVACPYHAEFVLKCTQAGTTSTSSLDTTSATLGKIYTDGGVKWEVIKGVWEAATQAEAKAGLDNNKGMTPLRTKETIDAQRPIKSYTADELWSMGFQTNGTWLDLFSVMEAPSEAMFMVSLAARPNLNLPVGGTVRMRIEKHDTDVAVVRIYPSGSAIQQYIAKINSTGLGGWAKVVTGTNVNQFLTKNFPNYNATVDLGTATTFTAPSDGWLFLTGETGNKAISIAPKVNGVAVSRIVGWSGEWAGTTYQITIPLSKDDVVTDLYSTGISYPIHIFVPVKE